MIKDAYKETLKMLKVIGQVVIVFSVIALVVVTITASTLWLVETYFCSNLFCTGVGIIVDFILSIFVFNLITAYLDKRWSNCQK